MVARLASVLETVCQNQCAEECSAIFKIFQVQIGQICNARKAVTLVVASTRLRLMVNHSHSQAVSWVVLHVFGSLGKNGKVQSNSVKKFRRGKGREPLGEVVVPKTSENK